MTGVHCSCTHLWNKLRSSEEQRKLPGIMNDFNVRSRCTSLVTQRETLFIQISLQLSFRANTILQLHLRSFFKIPAKNLTTDAFRDRIDKDNTAGQALVLHGPFGDEVLYRSFRYIRPRTDNVSPRIFCPFTVDTCLVEEERCMNHTAHP